MQLTSLKNSTTFIERLWDLWCIVSIVGIWPRFIEPRLLLTSYHSIPISNLPREFDGLKVCQISDLHFSALSSQNFLDRIIKRIDSLEPDLIVFTGDFLSYSMLQETERLKAFLRALEAPLGVFAIFGNHDYAEYVSLAKDGRFRRVSSHLPSIMRGLARLFSVNDMAESGAIVRNPINELEDLKTLIQDAGVRLLHNETVQIGKKNALMNLTGLGDYMTGQCQPQDAFTNYNSLIPGIVLSHNPDSYDLLQHYPGDLLLFGHTHGGQVNLPYIWKRVTPIKNKVLKSGLFNIDNRYLYVNRGLGATFPFRWFAPPEIAILELARLGPTKTPIWQKILPREELAQEPVCGTSRIQNDGVV